MDACDTSSSCLRRATYRRSRKNLADRRGAPGGREINQASLQCLYVNSIIAMVMFNDNAIPIWISNVIPVKAYGSIF